VAVDESDEVLRRIVFGRGSTREQVRAASDELQRRSSDTVASRPEQLAGATPGDLQQVDSPGDSAIVAREFRSRRRNQIRLVVSATVGCCIGIIGSVAVYQAGSQEVLAAHRGQNAGISSTVTTVVDTGSNGTLYQVPASEEAADPARADRWFDRPQTEQDALPLELEGIDASSSRHVGQVGADAGAWIARGVGGDYCAIIVLDDEVTSASSCAPPGEFLRRGTSVGTNGKTMFWTASTVITSSTRP
jgi:hypothetical protein